MHDGSSLLLGGGIVNRTFGKHNKLYVSLFFLTVVGPIYFGPPWQYGPP